MSEGRVAISGIDTHWGEALALALSETDEVQHILGLGSRQPTVRLDKMEFVQLDLRHPMLEEVLGSHGIGAVAHLDVEHVLGTMHLASAAANVGVRRLVLFSSMRAYGARHNNPSFIGEDRRIARGPSDRDLYEIETFLADHQRARPDLGIVVLRFGWILGPRAQTPFSRYLDRRVVPTLLGFDPHFQLVHERDVVRALSHSLRRVDPQGVQGPPWRGVFNVAGDGVIPLSRILKRCGRTGVPVPHPLVYSAQRWVASLGREDLPFEVDFLRYSVIGSTEKMRTAMNFEPAHTGEDAVEAYVRSRRGSAGGPIVAALSALEAGAGRLATLLPIRGGRVR